MEIITKFTLAPSGRGYYVNEKAWSLDKILEYISENQKKMDDRDLFLSLVYEKALKGLYLKDKNENQMNLTTDCFNPFCYDKTMFLFGELMEVRQYRKDCYSLKIHYVNAKGVYTGTFEVSEKKYNCMELKEEAEKRRYVAGTVIRCQKKIQEKRSYNPKSHLSYVIRESKEIYRNKILVCSMRNI